MTKPSVALGIAVYAAFGDAIFETSPTFTDLTGDVIEWSIDRGVTSLLQPYQAGRASFQLDDSVGGGNGGYDPGNSGGAYYGDLGENTQVLIQATPNGSAIDLYRGYTSSWERNDQLPSTSTVDVICEDLFKQLGGWEGVLSDPSAARSHERAGGVLDDIGVPAGWQEINGNGSAQLAARGAADTVNGLTELQMTSIVEGPYCAVFVTRSGIVRWDGKVQLTAFSGSKISTAGTPPVLSQLPADIPASAQLATIQRGFYGTHRGTAQATTANGTVVTATAAATGLGVETYSPDYTEVTNDLQAAGQLGAAMTMFGVRRFGPRTATFTVWGTGTVGAAMLGTELRDRVRVKTTSPQGVTVDEECFVIGIRWSGNRSGQIAGSFTLVTADFYDDLGPDEWMIVGDATLGKVGTGKVAP